MQWIQVTVRIPLQTTQNYLVQEVLFHWNYKFVMQVMYTGGHKAATENTQWSCVGGALSLKLQVCDVIDVNRWPWEGRYREHIMI